MQLQAEYKLEKDRIARSFASAARSYDAYASLQRSIADNLMASILTGFSVHEKANNADSMQVNVQRILDLGSGTGYSTKALHRLFPAAEIVSLDIAQAMLMYAREQHTDADCNEKYICADAEALPFNPNSFDLIFSSLSIQWCQNYSELFSELQRVLRPSREIHIATFGPETLQELKQVWQEVDAFVHVNRFQSDLTLRFELENNAFRKVESRTENLLVYYRSFEELARELKSIGAHNMNQGQGHGLSGRGKISRVKAAFEKESLPEAGVPVTYQVYYFRAQL